MNKTDLIDAISKDTKLSKTDIETFLDGFKSVVTKALKKGQKVSLIGFLTIENKKRSARIARNPRTGKEIKVAAKNFAKMKAGKALNDALN